MQLCSIDRVLADFDWALPSLSACPAGLEKRWGSLAFLHDIARHGDFYRSLPLIADAMRLFEAVGRPLIWSSTVSNGHAS